MKQLIFAAAVAAVVCGCRTTCDRDYFSDKAFVARFRASAIEIAKRKIAVDDDCRRSLETRVPIVSRMNTGGGFSGFFVWDSVFGVLWGLHAPEANLPLVGTLDNFYALQGDDPDGFICREYSRDGKPCWDRRHPCAYNPPILAWGEVELFRAGVTNLERLRRVYPCLVKFHGCYTKYLRRPDGLYFSDMFGCGMDDLERAPFGMTREERAAGGILPSYWMLGPHNREWWVKWFGGPASVRCEWNRQAGWIDMSAQMAFDCLNLAEIARAIGKPDEAARWMAEHAEIARVVNAKCWDEKRGFYFDCWEKGIIPRYHIGAFWTLLAHIPSAEQAARMIRVFEDPQLFGGKVPVASSAPANADYCTDGYWVGQTWPPTTYVAIRGLRDYGYVLLAGDIARRWYNANAALFEKEGTVFENISSNEIGVPGARAARDFCGWGALAAVAIPAEFDAMKTERKGKRDGNRLIEYSDNRMRGKRKSRTSCLQGVFWSMRK